MPLIEPFWLLYPDSDPPHPGLLLLGSPPKTELLPAPDPPAEPGVLVFDGAPPHPVMTKRSATAKEQRKQEKGRNILYSRQQPLGCEDSGLLCQDWQFFVNSGCCRFFVSAAQKGKRDAG
jgi:hypothetical protein